MLDTIDGSDQLGNWMGRNTPMKRKRPTTVGFYVKLPKGTVREIRSRAKRLGMTQADTIVRWMIISTAADEAKIGK